MSIDRSHSIGRFATSDPRLKEEVPSREDLANAVFFLSTVGPDALFRMILKKLPQDRTPEELELVYEELLHVKALSHLSTMVKRELATVIGYEHHTHAALSHLSTMVKRELATVIGYEHHTHAGQSFK
ncbi:unnamed protein product [Strongylus vulgaris]|uniref:Uncharacterized protein n=1 Tax=Strongylus vulgaris TaxID=40348 RepID=A0A3P7JDG2_STRVU|nr:unnamed protein product [Strongylus vulgaris]